MLYIHTSNQLEQLSLLFSTIVNKPLSSVFTTEMVVVQNAGMARYLSMQVATIGGISANTEYLFPAEFMWRLLRLVSPDIPELNQCTPETLRFHIMEELSKNPEKYPELKHYIFNQDIYDEQLTWELSCQLADTLDRTLYYRSEWVEKWENNPTTESQKSWQARLWINCVTNKNLMHWLHLQKQFKASVINFDTTLLPERISFFSMSSLSPGYLDLIGEIAKKTDIHIYVINPCQDEYWGDIASEKARSKLSLEKQDYVDVGNPLLASMGVQGRDFIDQLLNLSDGHSINPNKISATDQASPNNPISLLKRIQEDIYSLSDPKQTILEGSAKNGIKGGRCTSSPSESVIDGDNSIVFNACHTTMREVEVLHDQILDALNSDSSLNPSDILVMMPDVEKYAPYIESIFSSPIYSNRKKSLPFSIADRDPLNVHQLIEVLLKVLQLADSQFDVESVFEILDYEAVYTSFNLSLDQVDQCRELAEATNIRWGIDAKGRAKSNYPKIDEHTWKYALDCSLLGYALGNNTDDLLFETAESEQLNLLAYSEIEGSNGVMLSNFKHFTDTVFTVSQWQYQKSSLDKWLEKLSGFIQQLFSVDDYASDLALLLKAIDKLKSVVDLTQFQRKISFTLFSTLLKSNLKMIEGHEKFLGYGITFCALVPMRSVPFKVIALMGMNDGEYPRQDKHSSFDNVAKSPRRGDRSRRDEDRYLFLESVLASRGRLIISYIGQSIKDNSDLPPSVLVSELLDVIEIYTKEKPETLITKHPLQAFSPRYFQQDSSQKDTSRKENNLFSYASQYTHLKSRDGNDSSKAFISQTLDELEDDFKTLSMDDLIRFYQNPARYFLKARFDIKTYDDNINLATREPFKIESFKNRQIRQIIYSASEIEQDTQQIARAKGLLPYGNIGDALFEKERKIVERFKEDFPHEEPLSSKLISLELKSQKLGRFSLHGSINNINQDGDRIVLLMDSVNYIDAIGLWITHLILNIKSKHQTELRSPEDSFILKPVENAKQQLINLLENYWKGLHYPLPFFPKSAYAMFKDNGEEKLVKAVSAWKGSDYFSGERDKFENTLLYPEVVISANPSDMESPQVHEFIQLSREVFGKYFNHQL